MSYGGRPERIIDHCRIGSLEICGYSCSWHVADHCRIGSLENFDVSVSIPIMDHCRIGSLEMR